MSSDGMTQLQAYKHLLDVAQNILQSLDIDRQIIFKYQTLKKGIKSKIKLHQQLSSSKQSSTTSIYKTILQSIVTCLHEFQLQIQHPSIKTFQKSILQFQGKFKTEMAKFEGGAERKKEMKVEVGYFEYIFDEIVGRLGNLDMLLEVHEKMQEIVQQTARKEVPHREKELEYEERIKKISKQLEKVRNVEGYLKQVEEVRGKREQVKVLEKELKGWMNQFV